MRGEPSSLRSPVTVHFACPKCAWVYTAVQEYIPEKLGGRCFDCTVCKAEVHSWSGPYDFSIWKVAVAKPPAGQAKLKDNLQAKLEKLLTEAEDCEILGRLAADKKKRELFRRLATDLRSMARDIEAMITRPTTEPK